MKQGLSDNTFGGDSVPSSNFETQVWMHNDIYNITADIAGKLWLGTKAFTYIYDGKTFNPFHGSPTFSNIRSIIQDKKGNIWLGGKYGLYRYNGRTFTNFSQDVVGYIYEDKKGNIWTTSESKKDRVWVLSRYDEISLNNEKPIPMEIKSKYKGDKGMLYGILEGNDGSIWVGSGNGVYRYDGKTFTDLK
jgi:ligand-binding sensor domain-containing protein